MPEATSSAKFVVSTTYAKPDLTSFAKSEITSLSK